MEFNNGPSMIAFFVLITVMGAVAYGKMALRHTDVPTQAVSWMPPGIATFTPVEDGR